MADGGYRITFVERWWLRPFLVVCALLSVALCEDVTLRPRVQRMLDRGLVVRRG